MFSRKNLFLCLLLFICFNENLVAQSNNAFRVSFIIDYSSAEEALNYFEWKYSNVQQIANLPGNQLAIATSILLSRENVPPSDFLTQMESARGGISNPVDRYGLAILRERTADLRKLLNQVKSLQLDRRISATLAGYFPDDRTIEATFPVYIVAFGNDRAAAVVRKVRWENQKPIFTEDGEPTILLNLSRFLDAGSVPQSQAFAVMVTLTHECFHTVYSIFEDLLPDSLKPSTPAEQLLELVHNEGIAYYLSLELQRQGNPLSTVWFQETAKSIETLKSALKEISSPYTPPSRVRELILNANLSGSFTANYGVAAGQRMAYEIDTRLGRRALTQSIPLGFREFVRLYNQCAQYDSSLPKLDEVILK
jgi:hypothetical protein